MNYRYSIMRLFFDKTYQNNDNDIILKTDVVIKHIQIFLSIFNTFPFIDLSINNKHNNGIINNPFRTNTNSCGLK